MNIKELLNRELSFEEMNELLNELMDYGCNTPADSSERFYVYDDGGDICDFRKHIGMKALNTLSGILLEYTILFQMKVLCDVFQPL